VAGKYKAENITKHFASFMAGIRIRERAGDAISFFPVAARAVLWQVLHSLIATVSPHPESGQTPVSPVFSRFLPRLKLSAWPKNNRS
jgi:hypothetical protein